jgi:mRNA-degrading endonuclease YafQ of YafQ-DinJ toxin-antitoxin module
MENVEAILRLLISGNPLPIRRPDHPLKGEYRAPQAEREQRATDELGRLFGRR